MPFRRARLACLLSVAAALTGCSTANPNRPEPLASTTGISGRVHGGQQPVVGASVQLYTVGTSGDASPATPLLSQPVTTDANGSFNITGLYSCTSATLVYLVATGGNPGAGAVNPALALMTALGPCSSLTPTTYITVNELTTVAATSALAPYMVSAANVGSGGTDVADLQSAFTLAGEYVDPTTGTSPGNSLPSGFTPPTATINTLGDVAAACVNSTGGAAGDPSACGQLFSLTTPPGAAAPTNTLAALLDVAQSPGTLNTAALFALAPATAPFQPALTTAPASFQVAYQPAASSGFPDGFSIGPGSLAFANTPVNGTSATETITLSNMYPSSGTSSTIPIGSITLAGANPSDFTLATTCATSLPPFTSCTVSIAATPHMSGQQSASVIIHADGSTFTMPLLVTGVTPVTGVTLTPSLTFTTAAGTVQDLTLSNFGASPLEISSIAETSLGYSSGSEGFVMHPADRQYFSIASTTCGTTLPAQSACTISVGSEFASTDGEGDPYTYTGSITVYDNDAGGSQTASLSTTTAASLSCAAGCTQSGVTFAQQQVGTTATVHLSYGVVSARTPIGGIGLSLGGRNPSDFSVVGTEYGMGANAVGNSCAGGNYGSGNLPGDIAVTFTPQAAGSRSAKLFLNYSGTGEYVPLNGTAVGPGPSFTLGTSSLALSASYAASPDPLTRTATSTVTLRNTGTANFSFGSTVSGPASPALSVNGSACAMVLPQASCTFTVTFAPSTVGQYVGTVTVLDTNSTHSQPIAVTGTAQYDPPVANPSSLQFGAQAVGFTSAPKTFTVADGNNYPLGHPLTITLISGSQFTLPGGASCPASTTQTCTFAIAFSPTHAGIATEYPTVTDTVTGLTYNYLFLQGTAGTQTLGLSTAAVTFPARAVGTTSVPVTVTVTATGTLPVTITGVSLSGVTDSNFTETTNCPANGSLAAGATCTVGVSFSPVTAGTQGATLQVLSNASGSPATATVTGTAN